GARGEGRGTRTAAPGPPQGEAGSHGWRRAGATDEAVRRPPPRPVVRREGRVKGGAPAGARGGLNSLGGGSTPDRPGGGGDLAALGRYLRHPVPEAQSLRAVIERRPSFWHEARRIIGRADNPLNLIYPCMLRRLISQPALAGLRRLGNAVHRR